MVFKKICVLGLGYIGLPTGSTFATHGVEVVGVDINPQVIDTLRNGGLHIHEPGLRTLVGAALGSGNLRISDQPEPADAFIIAVPTPFQSNKQADLSYVISAAKAITPHLAQGDLVVLESTSPPRTTTDIIAPILNNSGLIAGEGYHLAYSPERVLPGHILRELIENARVIGGINPCCAEAGKELYKIFVRGEIILTNATTAEMVKLMENTYRDVNIAIANEFSRLSERFGIDVWGTIAIANKHPRVNILQPGPGVGGHCISVDPWFLVEAAPDITELIQAARHVNDEQPLKVVNLIRETIRKEKRVSDLRGTKLTILGLSYKADVDDVRESPAIAVARLLNDAGATVYAYDPYLIDYNLDDISVSSSIEEAVEDSDLIALLVPHRHFLRLQPDDIAAISPTRLIVDTVNILEKSEWQSNGFKIRSLGVG